jgi:hypothetical protein
MPDDAASPGYGNRRVKIECHSMGRATRRTLWPRVILALARDGYALVRCEAAVFKREV